MDISNSPEDANPSIPGCGACAGERTPPKAAATLDADTTRFRVATMDCAAEESEIRRALDAIAGIRHLRFDLGRHQLDLSGTPQVIDQAAAAMRRIGFDPQPVVGADPATPGTVADAADHASFGAGLWRLTAALLLAVGAEALAFFAPDLLPWRMATMALALAAIALAGLSTYKKGFAALRAGRLNINALMTVAVTGAFVIGQWPEAAMVMALYAIAELIEARAVDRARNAIRSLLALAPEDAEVRQADGSWSRIATTAVAVGAIVRIRPGERVPLDGSVTEGRSAIDQAPVTGESIPVDKGPGDAVYAGTINQAAALEMRVTAPASDSTLARIIHAVEQAQGSRAPTQRFVDRFAAVYTPAVFALAVALVLIAPTLAGWTWMQALYKALVLLVIACPCALVISTPVTVVSGLAAAARRGILIKGGVFLEQARGLRVVAMDKTGTLTEGKPRLVAFEPLTASPDGARLALLAKSLAARSDHPVSSAIAQGLDAAAVEVQDFAAEAGRGVRARIDGADYVLANHRWIEERGQCSPAIEARLQVHEQAGRSVTLLASAGGVLAICAVADTLKPSSAAAVAELEGAGRHAADADRRQPGDGTRHCCPSGHRRGAGQPAARRKAGRHPGHAVAAGPDRDGRRRHQRRTRAGAGRHRHRDGRRGHAHRDGSGRRGDHERRPAAPARDDPAVAGDAPRAVAEHRARARHQGGVPGARGVRPRDDVDGGVRRHGCEPAGRVQRAAAAARPVDERRRAGR